MIHIDKSFLCKNSYLLSHKKCVFVIGAGISVASGIPDFRSPDGIFATLRKELKINGKELFTYDFGLKEGSRKIYLKYISSLKRLCDKALPNDTHKFLTTFPKSRIYTQNINGLEEKAGMIFSKTENTKGIYLHGNLATISCQYCGFKKAFEEQEISCFENGIEVHCIKCEERRKHCVENGIRKKPIGVMHPAIIHYQQIHPDGAFISKMCAKDLDCDLLIVIGTSLYVDGVKKLVKAFCRGPNVQGKRILINLTKPNKEWENFFDYFYEGDCNEFINTVENQKKIQISEKSESKLPFTSSKSLKKTCNLEAKSVNFTKTTDKTSSELPFSNIPISRRLRSSMKSAQQPILLSSIKDSSEIPVDNKIYFVSKTDHEDKAASEIDAQVRRLSLDSKQSTKTFEHKLKILTKSFSDEETIDMNVLDEAIKSSTQTEVDSTFCSSLQNEIESIIKESYDERDNGNRSI